MGEAGSDATVPPGAGTSLLDPLLNHFQLFSINKYTGIQYIIVRGAYLRLYKSHVHC